MNAHHAPRRPAYTLVETLIVVSIMAVVFVSLGSIMHHLAKLEHRLRREVPESVTIGRLSQQWRADAHDAVDFQSDEGSELGSATLHLVDGTTIEYRAQSKGIERRRRREQQQIGRDYYRIPDLVGVAWRRKDSSQIVVMQLSCQRGRISNSTDSVRHDTVYAALNLHQQLPPSEEP